MPQVQARSKRIWYRPGRTLRTWEEGEEAEREEEDKALCARAQWQRRLLHPQPKVQLAEKNDLE